MSFFASKTSSPRRLGGDEQQDYSIEAVERYRRDDPLARRTGWDVLRDNDSTGLNRKLVRVRPSLMEFRLNRSGGIAYLGLIAAGLALMALGFGWFGTGQGGQSSQWIVGALLVFMGSFSFYAGSSRIVFDKQAGYFEKTQQQMPGLFGSWVPELSVPLNDIHALQLTAEWVPQPDSAHGGYHLHELDLVLKDAARVHVVASNENMALRQQARVLARFLGCPLWDVLPDSRRS